MSEYSDDACRELVREFLARGLVPEKVESDVQDLMDGGQPVKALRLILTHRKESKRQTEIFFSDNTM